MDTAPNPTLEGQLADLSRDDLLKLLQRQLTVRNDLAARLANLVAENADLLGALREYEGELAVLRSQLVEVQAMVSTPTEPAEG